MHRCVWEAQHRSHRHRDGQAFENTDDASDGDVESDVPGVDPAQHDDCVEEHGGVADQHQVDIKEDCLGADITEALDSVGFDNKVILACFQSYLDELFLPVNSCLVCWSISRPPPEAVSRTASSGTLSVQMR